MPQDFGIGVDVGIYDRQIRLYDCDEYTRQFFQSQLNITLPPGQSSPQDNFAQSQIKVPPKRDGEMK